MWVAIGKELLLLAKEIGQATVLEMLRSLRRTPDPKKTAERIIQAELNMRGYRP